MAKQQRYGGSFAPPLDAAKIAAYRSLGTAAGGQVGEAVGKLCDMVAIFQQTPVSTAKGVPHPSGRGIITPLEDEEIKRIWDAVPWDTEIAMLRDLFETIDPKASKPLRDAAFHLLWFAVELEKDREPMTADKL